MYINGGESEEVLRFHPTFSWHVRLIIYSPPDFFTPLAIRLRLYSKCAWLTHDWLLLKGKTYSPSQQILFVYYKNPLNSCRRALSSTLSSNPIHCSNPLSLWITTPWSYWSTSSNVSWDVTASNCTVEAFEWNLISQSKWNRNTSRAYSPWRPYSYQSVNSGLKLQDKQRTTSHKKS